MSRSRLVPPCAQHRGQRALISTYRSSPIRHVPVDNIGHTQGSPEDSVSRFVWAATHEHFHFQGLMLASRWRSPPQRNASRRLRGPQPPCRREAIFHPADFRMGNGTLRPARRYWRGASGTSRRPLARLGEYPSAKAARGSLVHMAHAAASRLARRPRMGPSPLVPDAKTLTDVSLILDPATG